MSQNDVKRARQQKITEEVPTVSAYTPLVLQSTTAPTSKPDPVFLSLNSAFQPTHKCHMYSTADNTMHERYKCD